jgi:Zn-dependent peptidase ImmA (M78 family)/transcriptional regulator with XRE-family HTH domain
MIGDRIKQARKGAGLSLRGLAGKTGNYISAQVIQKYENGKSIPGSDVIIKLAEALGVKVEYFFRPDSVNVSLSAPAYRKRASMSTKSLDSLQAKVKDQIEKQLEIESLFPADRFKRISVHDMKESHINKMEDVEKLAESIRSIWSLGLDPIEDMTGILEDHGSMIILLDAEDTFDGLSCWANGDMPVIVSRKGLSGDRQRSNLAHELGHLIMNVSSNVDEEKAAKRFSGAFLVPADDVYRELGRQRTNLDLAELNVLKKKYGMSMQQWIYRAKDLGVISESRATQLFKTFRMNKWHRVEPGDIVPEEITQRYKMLVVQAVSEGLISPVRAAELLDEPFNQIRKEMMGDLKEADTRYICLH